MSDTTGDVQAFIDAVTPAKRRRDAQTLLDMMKRVTGQPPRLVGSIIGFGSYHYKYPSGREGDTAAAGFAPRKQAMTIYLVDGIGATPRAARSTQHRCRMPLHQRP